MQENKEKAPEANKQPEDINPFEKIIPSTSKFFDYALKITFVGIIMFPILALLIRERGGIHMWVMFGLDLGLHLSLQYVNYIMRTTNQQINQNVPTAPQQETKKQK